MSGLFGKMRVVLLCAVVLAIQAGAAYGQAGAVLYDKKCGRCHDLFEVDEYTADEWPGEVRAMKAQASLTPEQYEEIVNYLVNASSSRGSILGKMTMGGYLYTEYFQTEEKTKNFDIHYLTLYASGWAGDKINYFAEFELEHGGTGGNNTFVEQAYIDYWVLPNLAIKVGAMLTPFNRFDEFHPPLLNYTVTRPQMSREIGVSAWKDVGVDLHGYINLDAQNSLSFDLYTINGLGEGSNLRGSRQYRDNNEDKAFGGRLNLMFHDVLEIGMSAYRGAWDNAGDYDLNLFGAHMMLRTSVVDLYGEFASATSENPPGVDDGDMSGFFIQASRQIKKKFRPTIRYGDLDYLDVGSSLGRSTSKGNKDLSELIFCFGFYPVNRVVIKVEYTIFMEGSRITDKDNDQLGLQFAVRF